VGSRMRKAATGRTMRVATVFTGAATVGGAFVPAATAAPGHVAQPDITRTYNCGAKPPWVHIALYPGNIIVCFGFAGSSPNYSSSVAAECGGTNHGYINPQYPGALRQQFGPGNYYRHEHSTLGYPYLPFKSIQISGWSSHNRYQCPQYY
jgi:hypothetical protein